MALRIGDLAPNSQQDSTDGKIDFHKWAGNRWVVLFSHPRDFTPVGTTELGEVARLKLELEKRNVKAIGRAYFTCEQGVGGVLIQFRTKRRNTHHARTKRWAIR